MVEPLTEKQFELLVFIAKFINKHNQAPTFNDMAEGLGYNSRQAVHEVFRCLKNKGYVKNKRYIKRGIVITKTTSTKSPAYKAIKKAHDWQWSRKQPPSSYKLRGKVRIRAANTLQNAMNKIATGG